MKVSCHSCRGYDFFSVRLIFMSLNEHQKQYFYEWVFMSEIQNDLTLKKSRRFTGYVIGCKHSLELKNSLE